MYEVSALHSPDSHYHTLAGIHLVTLASFEGVVERVRLVAPQRLDQRRAVPFDLVETLCIFRKSFMSAISVLLHNSLKDRESKPFDETLAERTGREASDFRPPEDLEMPDLDELKEHDAADFYSED